jgi:hypothetical protein
MPLPVPRYARALGAALGCLGLWVLSTVPLAAAGADLTLAVRRPATASPTAAHVVGVDLDPLAYAELATRAAATVRAFPLPSGDQLDLELKRFDVLTPGARFVEVDASGSHDVPAPPFRAFRGTVLGDPQSRVTLNLFDGRIAGTIRTATDEYAVGSRPDTIGVAVWDRAHDPDRPASPFCSGEERAARESTAAPPVAAAGGGVGSSTLLEAHVAADASYEWYSHFGSLTAAQNYILNLIAQVSAIYEADIDVRIEVPYLRVFTTSADPYTNGGSTNTLLGELLGEWNAHQQDVPRTVAHLFSTWPSGGAGVAYIDVLCDHAQHPGNSYDYGVSALSANGGAWEKELVAHELGHNFSSPHTHCYVPEIDRCANENGCYSGPIEPIVGTIMSYCNQTTPVFHSRVQDQIRPAAEAAYPSCIFLADSGLPAPENVHRTDTVD